jgi:hypothetical protein
MASSPTFANFAGSISALSAIQPLDIKDNALLDLLIRDRFVGVDFGNMTVNPGSFATPVTPVTPTAPTPGAAAAASINLTRVAPGDLITATYINGLVDALLALDKRLAKIESAPRQTAPVAPTPPIVATPVPPVIATPAQPGFLFNLVNERAVVEIPAAEIENASEIRIGEIVIPRNEVTIEGNIARFSTPAALFRAGIGNTPELTIAATGGAARTFAGAVRPVG